MKEIIEQNCPELQNIENEIPIEEIHRLLAGKRVPDLRECIF